MEAAVEPVPEHKPDDDRLSGTDDGVRRRHEPDAERQPETDVERHAGTLLRDPGSPRAIAG
jgi:hypothetical protein